MYKNIIKISIRIYILFQGAFVEKYKKVFRQFDVLQLPEGGDFEAQNCLPTLNLIRSTKLDLTTEPPLLGRCC
jgi:hypothetical protein